MPLASIPEALKNCIADSEIEVLSWSAQSGELVLRIIKDVGPETGTIRFSGVAHVNIPPRFEIAGIGAYDCAFPDYPNLNLDDGEIAVGIEDVESHVHLVIAESVAYEIDL